MTGPLDRERIRELFDELSDELKWTTTRAQIYIVGGGCDEPGIQPRPHDARRRRPD